MIPQMQAADIASFWSMVNKTDSCWDWTGFRKREAIFTFSGKRHSAMRVAYELHFGPIQAGQRVFHTCGNRFCVRPEHLLTGRRQQRSKQWLLQRVAKAPNGCWLWSKVKTGAGYGHFTMKGKTILAHRYSWELRHGPIPKHKVVCHQCDNPACINPDHLFLGSLKDNSRDMVKKKRCHPRHGVTHPCHKLTEDEVRKIRLYHANGIPQKTLVAQFRVSASVISQVVHRKSWKHLA